MFLAMPSEALAETSEAANSFFNMPVLLFVAIIGATVGGEIFFLLPILLQNFGPHFMVKFSDGLENIEYVEVDGGNKT